MSSFIKNFIKNFPAVQPQPHLWSGPVRVLSVRVSAELELVTLVAGMESSWLSPFSSPSWSSRMMVWLGAATPDTDTLTGLSLSSLVSSSSS